LSLLKVTLAQIRVAEGRDDDAVAMFEEAFHAVAGSDEPQAVSVAVLAAMNIGRMLSRRQRESTRRLGAEWLQRGNELYLGMVGQAAIDRELAPTLRANPEYPPQAGRRGIEGWVQVEFTVNEAGGVEDLRVVDSEPPQVFDEAALEATRRWKYRPRVLLGAPVRTPGIRVVHRFDVGSPPRRLPPTRHAGDVQADSGQQAAIDGEIVALARANPRYPQEAMLRATEGWVVVEFTVNEAGAVEDARVVDSEPPQVFDEAALDAIRTWKYRPRIEGGVPVPRRGTQVTIRFERGTPPRRPPPTPGTAAW
jgi:TonB family protein